MLFIACIFGIQKWYLLPQIKKDKVTIIVISTFITVLLSFILIIIINASYFNADIFITTSIAFVFFVKVYRVFFIKWYNDKHKKIINIGRIIIALSLTLFGKVFLVLKFGGNKKNYLTNRSFKYYYN